MEDADTPTAIKIEDPNVLRSDFYQTTKAGGERQRLALACQICRHKKVKCNGELPKCRRCTDLDLPCEYKLTTHRRSRKSGSSAGIETRKDSTDPTSRSETDPPRQARNGTTAEHASKRQRSGDGRVVPSLQSPRNSVASLSLDLARPAMLASRPHQLPTGSAGYNGALGSAFLHQRHDSTRDTKWSGPLDRQLPDPLPRRKLLIDLCQVYFTKVHGQVYAFLHPPSFMQAVVQDVYSLNPALLLAICAISARFLSRTNHDELHPDLWASACVDIIFGVTSHGKYADLVRMMAKGDPNGSASGDNLGRPSVTCVQALCLISYYHFGEGQSSLAWVMSGFAVRMAHALHLNEEFYNDPIGLPENQPDGCTVSFRDREIRRRTFWSLFIMDRLNSAGEHRPFTILSDEVKIQLPVAQALFDRESPAYTAALDGISSPGARLAHDASANMDYMAWLIRILDIWGEVSCFVHRPTHSLEWSTDSPLMALRSRTMRWHESLPHHLRYDDGDSRHQSAGWYTMHAAYHLTLCVMHRFALPKPPVSNQTYAIDHIPLEYLTMCVKESIHNATRVSELIQRIPSNVKVTAPFIGFAAFSAATIHAFLGFHVYDMDAASVEHHRGFVHSTLIFLHDLGKAWQPLSKMHDALTSQVINRPRSSRSNNSSILHETIGISGQEQFRVPDTTPVQFSSQQQIELNTLAFANWFNNPTTQTFFDSSWPANTGRYANTAVGAFAPRVVGAAVPDDVVVDQRQPPTLPTEQTQRRPKPADAPYGDAFPIVEVPDPDDDAVAADLLVSFKQSDVPPPKVALSHSVTNGNSTTTSAIDVSLPAIGTIAHDAHIDRMSNLRDSTFGSGPVDILQLMKVGLITSQYWT